MALTNYIVEPVAIIGSSCRFPGGATASSKLWDLLKQPHDVLKEIPTSRFNVEGFYHEDGEHHGSSNVKHAYLLEEDHRVFDHRFFNISPREAETMDPQMRMLLETVYEGIESAGYSMQQLRGSSTAVFVGMMNSDFMHQLYRDLDSLPQYAATGMTMSIMSNRLSYFFDWHGPSVSIDTACSSSMVGLHQAVQALRNGESKVAVAAGTNIILGPEVFIAESKLHMLSPTGRSHMWDVSVDGYTRGEGIAAVVLKTLSQAIADGDHIECIIRDTGVNQDGRTQGITMPSAESQAALIRSTYARCGLDLKSPQDRPQFFEAHGTGTPAGDPIEAEAIHRAFFPKGHSQGEYEKLPVGSIKTVVGHLEGAAGLAGVIKASLAIQNSTLPPNLHFHELNPKIRPYYDHVYVPTTATPWPSLSRGTPRRVSVNSFGFGGKCPRTNAHAILESWPQGDDDVQLGDDSIQQRTLSARGAGPFVLSANSKQSLVAMAAALSNRLTKFPEIDLFDLAHTLSRRSELSFRASFSALSVGQLVKKLDRFDGASTRASTIPDTLPPRILGVFTGQGAQWPKMSSELYSASAVYRDSINNMQRSLDALPDGPAWSIAEQLSAPPETSRIHEASLSQPLCTAVQIATVDMLQAVGITFSAVVGHSSGEIGAAYAAGYLSASDAIRVAYCRGVHAKLAQNDRGQSGKMLAVSMSLKQATAFCNEIDVSVGKISVAANNSRLSCTLAGDADAIDQAHRRLESQGIFSRLLKVDTAYHSHHMKPCAGPYLNSMRLCKIDIQDGPPRCAWHSSVYGSDGRWRTFSTGGVLAGPYWVEDMTQPVLFSQAVQRAIAEEHCHDIVLEIGPHLSLKSPTSDIIKTLTGRSLPYSGILRRGVNSLESFANALGFVWETFSFPRPLIDFNRVRKSFLGNDIQSKPKLVKDMPAYCWDHTDVMWKESRHSKAFRTRGDAIHELLGHCVSHGEQQDVRQVSWRQVLKVQEIPWALGHVFQGQVLFPAAGYLVMAYEAAIRLVDDSQPVRLVDLNRLKIHRAMTLDENSTGTEVTFTIRVVDCTENFINADIACYSAAVDATNHGGDVLNFAGCVSLHLGAPSPDVLPPRVAPSLPMEDIAAEQLYSSLSNIGLDYSGDFRAELIKRRLNQATVTVQSPTTPSTLRIHPGTLDAAVHGLFAAFSFPGDGQLWTAYLPTAINSVRIAVPKTRSLQTAASTRLIADTILTQADPKKIICDVDLFRESDGQPELQIRGLTLTTFTSPHPSDDRRLYAQNEWVRDISSGIDPTKRVVSSGSELGEFYVRTAYFYLRRLCSQIHPEELPAMAWHHQHLMKFIEQHLIPSVEDGTYPDVCRSWESDTSEMLAQWLAKYPRSIDLQLAQAVGENLPAIVRGDVPPLQVMMQDGMLDRLYVEGLGFREANRDLAVLAGQLAHRYPDMKILEIGAGTGGATGNILPVIKDLFSSYTYTDISPGFFARARDVFEPYADRMVFKTLNAENNPLEQGYEPESYDLIIASNVLHATRRLEETMRNCRRLLRPGGHIMLLEITRDFLPAQLIMGTLPGWFLGIEDGRVWAPTISEDSWNDLLKKTGFSGVNTSATSFFSVMVSQADDDATRALREPLTAPSNALPRIEDLIIIGGATSSSLSLVREAENILSPKAGTITHIFKFEDIKGKNIEIPNGTTILALSDLDSAVFKDMHEQRFKGLQEIIRNNACAVLWVTRGALSGDDPTSNMIVGWGRCVLNETTDTKLQFLDLDQNSTADPNMLAEMLLRLVCADRPEFENVLWTVEHELALINGALYVPRVRQNEVLNHRHNSTKRTIIHQVPLQNAEPIVEIAESYGSLEVQELRSFITPASNELVQVQVSVSSVFALTCTDGQRFFLSIGHALKTMEKVLAWSDTRFSRSIVTMPKTDMFSLASLGSRQNDGELLSSLLQALLAKNIVSGAKGVVWVHDATAHISQAIEGAAGQYGVDLYFSPTNPTSADPKMHFIHPYIPKSALQSVQPKNANAFVNMQHPLDRVLDKTLRSVLPSQVRKSIFSFGTNVALSFSSGQLHKVTKKHLDSLQDAPLNKHSNEPFDLARAHVVTLKQVCALELKDLHPLTIIDWRATPEVSAIVRPLRHEFLFSATKTYFLIGLSGDLGLSLAEWMADNGARYIVVSSRNPKVPQVIIDHMAQKSVLLHVVALDITDREALHAFYNNIKTTMPPIGGVMNGAMVLRDRSFINTPWADFAAVLAPKVLGSQYLDELFYKDDLDFMIFFSSLASIVGNAGQAAYAAANLYMTSLANQRRRRGVPASVLYIGMVVGVGYVHHAESRAQYETQLRRNGCMAISEKDLHEMIAESIVCGRPDSDQPADLITGLQKVSTAVWYDNPRFAVDFSGREGSDRQGIDNSDEQQQGSQSDEKLTSQLESAGGEEEALDILRRHFVRALGRILQMSEDQLDVHLTPSSLGIDSLVAVQVRSWFLKELGTNIPVLKILGENTITQLCSEALAVRRRGDQGDGERNGAGTAALSTGPINWGKEISSLLEGLSEIIPPLISDGVTSMASNHDDRGLQVVLTGATGFVGTSILHKLIADDRVAKVHCVAIRPHAGGKPRKLKVQSPKIVEYAGDLTMPRLGLSEADFGRLAGDADTIIHNGAEVRFLQSYTSLRAANVGSTQALVAMAIGRRLPVHFVSTGAVALFTDEGDARVELPEISAAQLPPPADIDTENRTRMGYAASKWASEVLLERAPVPAVVHRADAILGPNAPATDLMSAIDRFSIRQRAVPAMDPRLWPGLLDIVDVEDVATGIVRDVLTVSASSSSPPLVVRNYCSNDKFGVQDLQRFYARKTGGDIALVTMDKWLQGAAELGLNGVLEFFMRDTYESKQVYRIPSLRKGEA
ncbi:hypothetical protein F4678DRAFT_484245 [Xylaria arbuscula]|nr:hypothetical protein F4678DRAFT_484245 [Xylaria arbuscula]